MNNRDYDIGEKERRSRGVFDRFDDLDSSSDNSADRGGFAPVRRSYSDRSSLNDAYPRYSDREEPLSYDNAGNGNVAIYSPKTYADVQDMIDNLRKNESIIVNLEEIEASSAQRILDFLSGAAYAIGGSMKRLKENCTFLITPQGTGITDTNGNRYSR